MAKGLDGTKLEAWDKMAHLAASYVGDDDKTKLTITSMVINKQLEIEVRDGKYEDDFFFQDGQLKLNEDVDRSRLFCKMDLDGTPKISNGTYVIPAGTKRNITSASGEFYPADDGFEASYTRSIDLEEVYQNGLVIDDFRCDIEVNNLSDMYEPSVGDVMKTTGNIIHFEFTNIVGESQSDLPSIKDDIRIDIREVDPDAAKLTKSNTKTVIPAVMSN